MNQREVGEFASHAAGDPSFAIDPDGRIDPIPYLLVCLSQMGAPTTHVKWRAVGRAIWGLTGGWPVGYMLFESWSFCYSADEIRAAWDSFCGTPAGMDDRRVHMAALEELVPEIDQVMAPLAFHRLFVANKIGPLQQASKLWDAEV